MPPPPTVPSVHSGVSGSFTPPCRQIARAQTFPNYPIVFLVRAPNTRPMNFTKNIGMILLAIFLILSGLMSLGVFTIGSMVMGILALLAGIFILIGK